MKEKHTNRRARDQISTKNIKATFDEKFYNEVKEENKNGLSEVTIRKIAREMIRTRQTTEQTFRSFPFAVVFYIKTLYEAIPAWKFLNCVRELILTMFMVEK